MKNIDKRTGLIKLVVPPSLYKVICRVYGKKMTDRAFIKNKLVE